MRQTLKWHLVAGIMLRRWRNRGNNGTETAKVRALAKIPVKTFPIKKRINTELFIEGEVMLYIQK